MFKQYTIIVMEALSMNDKKKLLTVFVLHCVWLVLALVIWILALVGYLNASGNDSSSAWFSSGAICLIPMLLPFIRFVINMARSGGNKGANTYDIDISYNHINVSNRRWLYTLIYLVIAIALGILAGLIVLPIYFCYQVYLSVRIFLNWRNTPDDPNNP